MVNPIYLDVSSSGLLAERSMLSPDFIAENLVNKIIGNKIFKTIVPVE
jgi:hypothetical protein